VELEFSDSSIARFVCLEVPEPGEARREFMCEDDLRLLQVLLFNRNQEDDDTMSRVQ